MLCLTIYEAKGLEFDDVILFNFFQDSKCGSQWMLVKDVDCQVHTVKKHKEFEFIDFEDLDIEEEDVVRNYTEQKPAESGVHTSVQNEHEEVITKLSLKRERGEVYRQYAQLCSELKFLYVAITRPKKVLIVYDEDNKLRLPLQTFLSKLNLVEVVSKDMLQDHSLLKQEVFEMFHQQQMEHVQNSPWEWKMQGISLFKKKFYHSAMQCFRNANEPNLVLRC